MRLGVCHVLSCRNSRFFTFLITALCALHGVASAGVIDLADPSAAAGAKLTFSQCMMAVPSPGHAAARTVCTRALTWLGDLG